MQFFLPNLSPPGIDWVTQDQLLFPLLALTLSSSLVLQAVEPEHQLQTTSLGSALTPCISLLQLQDERAVLSSGALVLPTLTPTVLFLTKFL